MNVRLSYRVALYGILGFPLSHTLSPAMQRAAFDALRLNAVYVPFEVPPAKLRHAVQLLRRLHVDGFNVTVPHKQAIIAHLDQVDETARVIGAVNTVVRRGRQLVGYNTDASGLREAWRRAFRRSLRGATVLLLGAGGAARAVLWALARARAPRIAIANRTARRAVSVARWSRRTLPRLDVEVVPWAQRHRWLATQRPSLIINATSLGLHADDALPVDLRGAPRSTALVDLAYRRPTTALVAAARRRGMLAFDGRRMLLYQGAQAFTLWTRQAAPLAVMQRALDAALAVRPRHARRGTSSRRKVSR